MATRARAGETTNARRSIRRNGSITRRVTHDRSRDGTRCGSRGPVGTPSPPATRRIRCSARAVAPPQPSSTHRRRRRSPYPRSETAATAARGWRHLITSSGDPPARSLDELRVDAARCTDCDLYEHATQTVFGAGPADAELMLLGEQPGDQEDRAGAPFVGPAGRLLDDALQTAEGDRSTVYVTNAVKHFKW